ncbi:MAG: hypothetical protein SGPRY_002405 [Prymnesium sp.]
MPADEVRRITSLLYISEMVRSRVELERLYARSFGDEEEPTPDKLRSLLRSYGGCYSDELSKARASRCPNHPTWFERTAARQALAGCEGSRGAAFARAMIEMGFHAIGPYESFREGLNKTIDGMREVPSLATHPARGQRHKEGSPPCVE